MLRKILSITALATVIATGVSMSASAYDAHGVVTTVEEGSIVRAVSGACVRTMWMDTMDKCPGEIYMQPAVTVYFDFDSAHLTSREIDKLRMLVDMVRSSREIINVNIVGYADRIGTDNYNYILSKKRAAVVNEYLVGSGIATRVMDTRYMGEEASQNSCLGITNRADEIACLHKERKVDVSIEMMYPSDHHMMRR